MSNSDRELTNMDYVEISGIRYKPTRKTVVTGWELPIGAGTPDLIYETVSLCLKKYLKTHTRSNRG